MSNEILDVDLTVLRSKAGLIDPAMPLELMIITNYRLVVDANSNTIATVNNLINEHLSGKPEYSYPALMEHVHEKKYNTVLLKYHNILEHILLAKVKPDVTDIIFDSILTDSPDEYIARFKVIYS